ncbi:MAG: hypothetical protein DRP42_06140 [Tenericutes bacterium]|nr:MAG: hypothetical protein DRP42_06140 [Mycoplasmatota bacterium]
MTDFYNVLDQNEIDGQGADTPILSEEADVAWDKVMIHPPQDVPEGEYIIAFSYQVSLSATNNSILWRAVGSVLLDEEEVHVDNQRPLVRGTYFFNLSWPGGQFLLDMEMARAGTSFTANCDYAEFTLTRRS